MLYLNLVFGFGSFFLGNVHGSSLDNVTLWCLNDWVLHRHEVTSGVQEDRRGRIDHTLNQRWLDQLELELLGRCITEHRAVMRQVELQVVHDAEGVREDRLRHERVQVVVIGSMLAKEACAYRANTLASNLELQDHLLLLAGTTQEKVFFAVSPGHTVLAPVLVQLDLGLVRDLKLASITALRVVNVDHEVGSLTGQEEALAHRHLQIADLASDKAYLLLEGDEHVELWIINDWSHR